MVKKILELFTSHPKSQNQTYLQHTLFALTSALMLFTCVGMLFVHAIFPFIFTNTTSRILLKLTNKLRISDDKSR